MKELRVYKTRPLARVAIMNFYKDNKPKIEKVYSSHKDQGIVMKDGTTIYFKSEIPNTKMTYNEIKFY
tara:strand:+ start:353 stop:556 length:204 start_codon:yes stop_codon:yes gene_type:complete